MLLESPNIFPTSELELGLEADLAALTSEALTAASKLPAPPSPAWPVWLSLPYLLKSDPSPYGMVSKPSI
jgi:hypothetical protein